VDKKTLKEILAKLKEEFEIDRCILVGDRGLISKENLEELENQDFESILALRKRRNREVKKVLKEGSPIYCRLHEQLEYREVKKEDGLRYILCRNPELAISQHRERQEDLAHLEAQLEQLKKKTASQKRPVPKRIIRQAEEILSHRHGHRFFNYRLEGRELTYFRKEEALALEKELDGLYILRTREPELGAQEIIEAYRDLADVERAFRTMKSVLDLRPFFHRTADRVRAHVFICVLAYLLEKLMEKALKRAQVPLSAEKALSSLKQMAVAVMKVDDKSYGYVSEPTYRQRQVLSALNIPLPSRVLVP
jgi:transposase